MEEFTTKWFNCTDNILQKHKDIEIRQRYCFIFTKDNKIVIVSKDNKDWQFPGGHPDNNEDWQKTLIREIWEETGIDIKERINSVFKIGYYLVEFPQEKFLQERYILNLNRESKSLSLKPHENEDDNTPIIKYVKAIPVNKIGKYIPWALEVDGWKTAINYSNKNETKKEVL